MVDSSRSMRSSSRCISTSSAMAKGRLASAAGRSTVELSGSVALTAGLAHGPPVGVGIVGVRIVIVSASSVVRRRPSRPRHRDRRTWRRPSETRPSGGAILHQGDSLAGGLDQFDLFAFVEAHLNHVAHVAERAAHAGHDTLAR